MTIIHLKCSGKVEVVATSPQSGQDWCVVKGQVTHHVELGEFFFFRFHFYPHLRYGFTSPSLPAFLSLQATLQPQPFPWEKHCQWSWGNPTCVCWENPSYSNYTFCQFYTDVWSDPPQDCPPWWGGQFWGWQSWHLGRRKLSTSLLANTSTVGSPNTCIIVMAVINSFIDIILIVSRAIITVKSML